MTGDDIDGRIKQWLSAMPSVQGYHHPDSRRATIKGWPDWVFLGENGILFREVKGTNDTLSPEQRQIGRLLQINGNDWRVWWPKDVRFGGIAEQELRAIA